MAPHYSSGRNQAGEHGTARVIAPLTAFVLRHRRPIIGFWLIMIIAGGAAAGQVSQRLTTDFSLPGQPGYETAQKMLHSYGNGGQPPSVLTVTVPAGESVRADAARIAAAFSRLRAANSQLRIVDYGDTRDPAFITSAGRTTYALVFAPQPRSFSSALASQRALRILQSALPPGYHAAATGLAVRDNTLTETEYTFDHATMKALPLRTVERRAGYCTFGEAGLDQVHRLGNAGVLPAVSLHIYGVESGRVGTHVNRKVDAA